MREFQQSAGVMNYQYQIDYGSGYEDVTGIESDQTENPDTWFDMLEAEGNVYRARVLLGENVIEERVFGCSVILQELQPNGSTRYLIQCAGGQVEVTANAEGDLSATANHSYIGNVENAERRAIETVKNLNAKQSI